MDALLAEYALIIERLDALFSKGLEEALSLAERAEVDDLRARALAIDTRVAREQMMRVPFAKGAHV